MADFKKNTLGFRTFGLKSAVLNRTKIERPKSELVRISALHCIGWNRISSGQWRWNFRLDLSRQSFIRSRIVAPELVKSLIWTMDRNCELNVIFRIKSFLCSECLKSKIVLISDSSVPISNNFFCLKLGQKSWDTSLGRFLKKIMTLNSHNDSA